MAASNTAVKQVFASPFLALQTDITWDEASTGTQAITIDYETAGQDLEDAECFLQNCATLTTPSGVAMATYKIAVDTATQDVVVTAYSGDVASAGAGGAPKTLVGLTTRLTLIFVPQAQQNGDSINSDVDF